MLLLGKDLILATNSLTVTHVKDKYFYILIVEGKMEQQGWKQLNMIPWVGNILDLPQGWILQVENEEFGH